MRDLEYLLSQVRNRESRKYFEEGVKAYQAGAYRASIVETWVAVSLDLISKIRYLAERNDTAAAEVVKKLDNAIQTGNKAELQKIENNLLKTAHKLELLTSREVAELERLYLDRNVCAHPAFVAPEEVFKPNAEQVRAHLASAVDNVLSLPAVSGRKLLNDFVLEITSGNWPSYPGSDEYVEHRFLKSARQSVKRGIVELIIKTAIEPPELDSKAAVSATTVSARARAAINSIALHEPTLLNDSIESVIQKRQQAEGLSDTTLLRIVGSLGQFERIWSVLNDSETQRICTLITNSDIETLKNCSALASQPIHNNDVEIKAEARRTELISSFEGLQHMIKTVTYGRSYLLQPVIASVRKAGSFRDAENRLRDFSALANEVDNDSLRELGKAVRANKQAYLAAETETILRNLCIQTKDLSGAGIMWHEIANGLHDDYRSSGDDRTSDAYSYSEFKEFVASTFG